MQNVIHKITGNKLLVEIDLDAPTTPSASGKTKIIATTSGNQKLDYEGKEVVLGLNLYTKA